MRRSLYITSLAALLCACRAEVPIDEPVEIVVTGPVQLEIDVEGEVRAVQSTPLIVPGRQWTRRQTTWLLADGEPVEKGDVIARFSPEQAELELSQTLIDLQRNLIARAGKQAELTGVDSRVAIDLADVAVRIGIARRYAGADFGMLARNEILDAIDDERFLAVRQDVLEWQRGNASERGETEFAVLDAQRATHQRNAEMRRQNLNALELRAPHAGVLLLSADWTGEKPRVGTNLMAGQVLGSLPNIAALEVELKLPQAESQGLAIGQRVLIHPVGRPEQAITTELAFISGSAQARSRENAARYITARAALPPDVVRRFQLVPEQHVQGRVEILAIGQGSSVPNVAIVDERGRNRVYVRTHDGFEARDVELGARGSARSQVLTGLEPGDVVRLTPPQTAAVATPGESAVE